MMPGSTCVISAWASARSSASAGGLVACEGAGILMMAWMVSLSLCTASRKAPRGPWHRRRTTR